MSEATTVETSTLPTDRIDARQMPNKPDGTAGRWRPFIVRDFNQFDSIEQAMEMRDADDALSDANTKSSFAKAIAIAFTLWTHVRLSEDERIAVGHAAAKASYENKCKKIELEERQRTRAYVLADAEEIDVDTALKRIRKQDKEATKTEKADGPEAAPTPVDVDDLESEDEVVVAEGDD